MAPPPTTTFTFSYRNLDLTKTDPAGNPLKYTYNRFIYPNPVPITASNFNSTIRFVIHSSNPIPADGFVFFMAPVSYSFPVNPIGGSLGIFDPSGSDTPNIFAIEFDIFSNSEWKDPEYPHVGINIESQISKIHVPAPKTFIGKVLSLKISYDEAAKEIRAGIDDLPPAVYKFDLKSILPDQVQVGLAATTGEYVSTVDVTAWDFTSVKNSP